MYNYGERNFAVKDTLYRCTSLFALFDILPKKIQVQLYSKKCTGRYFIIRDDDLSSKQESICTFKIMTIKITRKYVYIYIFT